VREGDLSRRNALRLALAPDGSASAVDCTLYQCRIGTLKELVPSSHSKSRIIEKSSSRDLPRDCRPSTKIPQSSSPGGRALDRQPPKCRNFREYPNPPFPYRSSANALANSLAQSMKSCATGLTVRFFKVTIPTGTGWNGISTDSAFNPKRSPCR
jgi:hypothetical protein